MDQQQVHILLRAQACKKIWKWRKEAWHQSVAGSKPRPGSRPALNKSCHGTTRLHPRATRVTIAQQETWKGRGLHHFMGHNSTIPPPPAPPTRLKFLRCGFWRAQGHPSTAVVLFSGWKSCLHLSDSQETLSDGQGRVGSESLVWEQWPPLHGGNLSDSLKVHRAGAISSYYVNCQVV